MPKIQDYAIIGNGRSAALISREGALEWLCLPKFDSPSLFAAILDVEKGGKWAIQPLNYIRITRNYIEGTPILQTRFYCERGTLCVTDFSPVSSESTCDPEHEIIRRVECEEGSVNFHVLYQPKPNFAQESYTWHERGNLGLRIERGNELITLHSQIKLHLSHESAEATCQLQKGERLDFALTYALEAPATLTTLGNPLTDKLQRTLEWWQKWSAKIEYKGPYKNEVIRSAITLKLLGYAPSGTFAAALTTSLPQKIGGDLNWDYRFCWLRDAAFTVRALFELGIHEEATSFVSWLLHSTRLTFPKLRVLYDVYGLDIKDDVVLPHLKGFENSYPVRIGNGVRRFFELDVYGEVIESVNIVAGGKAIDRETQKLVLGFGKTVLENWESPDTGIWEKMIPLKHYTHSKLMCWVALDRIVKLFENGQLKKGDVNKFREGREKIRKEIEVKGWSEKENSYVQVFEGHDVDSSLLAFPLYGFEEPTSERMQKTFQTLKKRLSPAPQVLYRYDKSTKEGEGVFGLTSFWGVEFLARGGGKLEEAHAGFRELLTYANDVGLYSEEFDPCSKDSLGNFPQAFTHTGLINAALAIARREGK